MRLRHVFYIEDNDKFEDKLSEKYSSNICVRNIMKLLFTNVEPGTFGLTSSPTNEECKAVYDKLTTYKVHQIVLGVAVIKRPGSF